MKRNFKIMMRIVIVLFLQFLMVEIFLGVGDSFDGTLNLCLSESYNIGESFLLYLIILTKSFLLISLFADDLIKNFSLEKTYEIIRYKKIDVYIIKKLLRIVLIITITVIGIVTFSILILSQFKKIEVDINATKMMLLGVLYLIMRYLIFTLFIVDCSHFFGKTISFTLAIILYVISLILNQIDGVGDYIVVFMGDINKWNESVPIGSVSILISLFIIFALICLCLHSFKYKDLFSLGREYE